MTDEDNLLDLQVRVQRQTQLNEEQKVRLVSTGRARIRSGEPKYSIALALLTALCGGLLAGYFNSNSRDEDRDPSERERYGVAAKVLGVGTLASSGTMVAAGGIHALLDKHPPPVGPKISTEYETIEGDIQLRPLDHVKLESDSSSYLSAQGTQGKGETTNDRGWAVLRLRHSDRKVMPEAAIAIELSRGQRSQSIKVDIVDTQFFRTRFQAGLSELLDAGRITSARGHLSALAQKGGPHPDLAEPYCRAALAVFKSKASEQDKRDWEGFGEEQWLPASETCIDARTTVAVAAVRQAVSADPPNSKAANSVLRSYLRSPKVRLVVQKAWCKAVGARFLKAAQRSGPERVSPFLSMPAEPKRCAKIWTGVAATVEVRGRKALKAGRFDQARAWATVLMKAPGNDSRGRDLANQIDAHEHDAAEREYAREEARNRKRYQRVVATWQKRIKASLARCNAHHTEARRRHSEVGGLIDSYDARAERAAEAFERWLDGQWAENGPMSHAVEQVQTLLAEMEEAESYGHDTQLRYQQLSEESEWACRQQSYSVRDR